MSGASIVSAGAFSRRERARYGTGSAETAAPNRYDVAYPHTSAALPRAGCAQTPPVEPIMESNERIVARCRDGIRPLRYVCRIGCEAANSSPQTTISPSTAQKLSTAPISASVIALRAAVAINAEVRRRNRCLIRSEEHTSELQSLRHLV